MAEPLLLTYNLKPMTADALNALCREQGIRVRPVRREEYALPIGLLAGIPARASGEASAAEPFDDEMLVMCHMLSHQLDAFLSGMRQRSLPRIALKAVLTPFNVVWTSARLRDDLAREHDEIKRRNKNP